MSKYNFNQNRSDYLSPFDLVQKALNYYGIDEFDLDTCCSQHNIPAKVYYVFGENDGLTEDWKKFNWCNPPYYEMAKWVKRLMMNNKKATLLLC